MKKVVSLFLFLVMLLSSVIPACAATSAQEAYEEAQQLLSDKQYDQAKQAFESLGAYQEATKYAMYIVALREAETGFFELAALNFSALGDFLDSNLRASYYSARNLENKQKYEEAGNVYLSIIAFMDASDRYTALPELICARDYAKADLLESQGHLEEARDTISELENFKDSPERVNILEEKIKARDYEKADKLEQQNKLEEALTAFIALAGYSDSAERSETIREKIRERDYGKAIALEQENQYSAAYKAFTALGDYKDSKDRAAALHDQAMYDDAMELADKGQYSDAAKIFASLGSYQDSEDKAYVLGVADFADETSSPVDGVFVFKHHGVYGISNYHDNVARPALYEYITDFYYGVAAYCLNNKWGLVYPDLSTTPAEWNEIGAFTNVQGKILAEVVRNGQHGYIDTAGKIVLAVIWDDVSAFNRDGVCYLVRKTNNKPQGYTGSLYHYGLADYQGNVIVDPSYTRIGNADNTAYLPDEYYRENKPTFTTPQAGNQLMIIRKDNKYGFMTESGYIIKPEYDAVLPFSDNLAAVQAAGLWGFINEDGKYVIEPEYVSVTSFSNGKADVLVKDNGWNIIDKENRRIYFTTAGIETADNLMASGEYEKAAELYESMSEIDPTLHEKAQRAWYKAAEEKRNREDYDGALTLFTKISGYGDSAEQVLKIHYIFAEKALDAQNWDIASKEFAEAGKYSDAESRILEPYYTQAELLLGSADYEGAIQAFGKAEGYKDSAERIQKIHYGLAEQAMEAKDWDLASSEFALAGEYSDASSRIPEPYYTQAELLLESKDYDGAIQAFGKAEGYHDSAERILKIHYELAEQAIEAHDWDFASSEFTLAGGYLNASSRILEPYYTQAELLLESGDYAGALLAFSKAEGYNDSAERILKIHYELAEQAIRANEWDLASSEFALAGGYSDASSRILEPYYTQAKSLLAIEDYSGAINAFSKAAGYKDSAEKILETHYKIAEKALVAEEWELAISEFSQAGEYSDASVRIFEAYYQKGEKQFTEGDYAGALESFGLSNGYGASAKRIKDSYVQIARAHMTSGEYEQAYNLLYDYVFYKDVYSIIQENESLKAIFTERQQEAIKKVGSKVFFGAYEIDKNESNGLEPIEWEVLAVDGDKALLVSSYVIDFVQYNSEDKKVTWEKSSLRKWLNNDFYNNAFNDKEKGCIVSTNVNNTSEYKETGSNTKDKIYLLGKNDINRYLKKIDSRVGRKYPVETEEGLQEGELTAWWLRNIMTYSSKYHPLYVKIDGITNSTEINASLGLRPAMWISVKKFTAK